jgi:sodium/potassium-transporting ATPase subunit alpha
MSDDVENQRITIVPTQSVPRRDHAGGVTLMTRKTLSIHAPTVPPSTRLPIEFRTLSLHLEHSKKSDHGGGKASKGAVKGLSSLPAGLTKANHPALRPVTLDLSELDWHRVSVDEALRRLAVAPKTGLEVAQAQRRAAQFGANRISPAPKHTLRKVIGWVFGGFGSLLLSASVVCFIAWYGYPPSFSNEIPKWLIRRKKTL